MKNAEFESNAWARSAKAGTKSLWWLVVACVWASCGRAPSIRYYTLQLVSPPPAVADPKTNYVLEVEPFRGPDIFHDDRILYYQSPTQIDFYQQHRWVADPATMLRESIQQRLQQMGVFAQVQSAPLKEPVDYVLKGRVLSLEEVDYEGGVKGRVGLELSLLRLSDRKVVWSAQRQAENAVQEKGVVGVVNALADAAKQVVETMTRALVARVEIDFQAAAGKATQ